MITLPIFRGYLSSLPQSYLVSENFESTGIPLNWTFSPNINSNTLFGYNFESDSPLPTLQGTGCLRVLESSSYFTISITGFGSIPSGETYFLFNPSGSLPGATHNFMFFLNEEGLECARLRWTNAGAFAIRLGGTGVDISTSSLATGFQTYHVWFNFNNSSGYTASASVGFSTDGVRPIGGSTFASRTGESTGLFKTFRFGAASSYTATYYIDKFRLSNKRISNYPS